MHRDNSNISFKEWLETVIHTKSLEITKPQANWLKINNKIAVDFVAKFENLEEDFKTVSKTIGYKGKLPHLNRTTHEHYAKYYDNANLIQLVEKNFIEDIDLFEYKYEPFHYNKV